MTDLFVSSEQFRDWTALSKAIDKADYVLPCTNAPDEYYPSYEDRGDYHTKLLKKMCNTQCPVVTDCLVYALKHEDHGIWGGTTASERQSIRRKGRIKTGRKVRSNNVL